MRGATCNVFVLTLEDGLIATPVTFASLLSTVLPLSNKRTMHTPLQEAALKGDLTALRRLL
jgi:hypothetical protein